MKILVVRYRFIGDTILTVPFLRNLRRAYPDAQIDMLVAPNSGDVLLECPYIDNLITFDTTRKHRYENANQKKKSFLSYVKLLRSNKYDKAYVLKRSLSSALLVFSAGMKERIGFDTECRGLLLTKKVPYLKDQHEIESFLDVLRADGINISDNYLEGWVNKDSEDKIIKLLDSYNIENKPKILIHATSGNKLKQWPNEYFAEIIEYLANEKGAQVFYAGTKDDANVYEEIHKLIKNELAVKPINLCGKLSIQESMGLISKMDFAVGTDSGTLHIAAAFKVPVVGIYGPMNQTKWKAWGDIHTALYADIPCRPCELRKKCKNDFACLKNITPDMVIHICNKMMEKIENAV